MKPRNKKKGSLTIEAVIAFSIFISFMFCLLSMVQISLTKITLENAVSETAKYIATASYPIGIFNDIAEDSNKKLEADLTEHKLDKDLQGKGMEILYDYLLADSEAEGLKNCNEDVDELFEVLSDAGINTAKTVVLNGVEKLITQKASDTAGNIVAEVIDNSYVPIDKSNLTITIAKLPVPKQTYDFSYNTASFQDMGLTKNDFNEDDVVIGVEYAYKLSVPFITSVDIKMCEVAVEHAWVNGGAGNVTKRTEGLKMSDLEQAIFGDEVVYITATGKKYHKENCYYLWASKIKRYKNDVIGRYEPCKKCAP